MKSLICRLISGSHLIFCPSHNSVRHAFPVHLVLVLFKALIIPFPRTVFLHFFVCLASRSPSSFFQGPRILFRILLPINSLSITHSISSVSVLRMRSSHRPLISTFYFFILWSFELKATSTQNCIYLCSSCSSPHVHPGNIYIVISSNRCI